MRPLTRRLASRRASSIAVARACAARRSARSRRSRRRGPSNSVLLGLGLIGFRLGFFDGDRFGDRGVDRIGGHVGRLGGLVGLGHRNTPGAPGALRLARTRSAVTISGPQQRHVAGAHRDDDVAGTGGGGHLLGDRGEIRQEVRRHADVLGDAGAADTGQRLFAGAVHVENEHLVGGVECATEVSGESLCPRIQVGLEHHQRPAFPALLDDRADRRQRRGDLGRMVGVVVEHSHRPHRCDQFEAATHALETGQSVEHLIGRGADLDRGQQRPQCVERHVPSGHRQPHRAHRFRAQLDVCDGSGTLLLPRQQRPGQSGSGSPCDPDP